MKLYEVRNGWMGESYISVIVIAESEKAAIELARSKYKGIVDKRQEKFIEEYKENMKSFGKKFADKIKEDFKPYYDEGYYNCLEAECLCNDVSIEWASEPNDS